MTNNEENMLSAISNYVVENPEVFAAIIAGIFGLLYVYLSRNKHVDMEKKASPKRYSLAIPESYRNYLKKQCRNIDLGNLVDKKELSHTVGMPEIFIPLFAVSPEQKKEDREEENPLGERAERGPVNIEDLAAERDVLLQGHAGSGKTTFLRHLAYEIITNPKKKGFEGCLPVLVLLRETKKFLAPNEEGVVEVWERILKGYFHECLPHETVVAFAQAGKVVFLADGLDELEEKERNELVVSLVAYVARYGGKVVLSGRPHVMKGEVLRLYGGNLTTIAEFTPKQVEEFVRKWNALFSDPEDVKNRNVTNMLGDIRASRDNIGEMIGNPLLLTAICIIYRIGGRKIPEQRAELFEMFVSNLLPRRFDEKLREEGKEIWKDGIDLNVDTVGQFLRELANHMQRNLRETRIDHEAALRILANSFWRFPEGKTFLDERYKINKAFECIEEKCGILKRLDGGYEFRVLSFQEFLTAQYIAMDVEEFEKELGSLWEDERQRNVLCLCIGLQGMMNRKLANGIVRRELEREDGTEERKILASTAFLNMRKSVREPEVVELVRNNMEEMYQRNVPPVRKARAGEIVGRLGDTRKDLKRFVAMEGGEYDLEKLGRGEVRPFEIGKYPVTNQWFQEFIDAGGYREKEYWSIAGKKWLSLGKRELPELWHDRRFNCPNAPVVGISWWEADAFCRWLNSIKAKDDPYTYRLPTEVEWQIAAAGHQEKRQYPWGNEWNEDVANTSEAKISQPSAVGIFPRGATPAEDEEKQRYDMAGNVWEWTCSEYKDRAISDDFPCDIEVQELYDKGNFVGAWELYSKKKLPLPVLRGGSWDVLNRIARCADRLWYLPSLRSLNVGFRCARTL